MDEKDNGQGSLTDIEKAELEKIVGEGSIDKALKAKDDAGTAVKYIMTTDGEDLLANALRFDIKDYRSVIAFASLSSKCIRHGYTEGENELKLILGLLPAIRGKRVNIFSDTVIGERKNFSGQQSNWGEKIKQWAFNQKP